MSIAPIRELLEKPLVWLILVGVLLSCSGALWVSGSLEWSSFGLAAIGVGLFGRVYTAGPISGGQRWVRSSLWMIGAFLFFPVVGHQLTSGADGKPWTFLGHMVNTGFGLFNDMQHNLAESPPLKASVDTTSELLGVIRTDYLTLVNVSDKGIFPVSCKLRSDSQVYSIMLPEVIKPYDTVKIELKTSQGKVMSKQGDTIVIECKDYGKPLSVIVR